MLYRAKNNNELEVVAGTTVVAGENLPNGSTVLFDGSKVPSGWQEVEEVYSNPNLLINGDFRNPINQRGAYSWNTVSYMIDRWLDIGGYDHLITLTENGLLFNVQDTLCVFEQRLEERYEIGDTFTVTLEMDNVIKSVTIKCVSAEERNEMNFFDDTQAVGVSFYRTISPTANITTLRIIVYKDELTISRVKLEQGFIATPFVTRLYAEELALCQRYCVNLGGANEYKVGYGMPSTTSKVHFICDVPSTLRAIPTLYESKSIHLWDGVTDIAISQEDIKNISVYYKTSRNKVQVLLELNDTKLTLYRMYHLVSYDNFIFDAEIY